METSTKIFSSFETLKNNKKIQNNDSQCLNDKLFEQLIYENEEINKLADKLIYDINNMEKTNEETLKKNLTFKSIISTLKLGVAEYKYQKEVFKTYAEKYLEIFNEENSVKLLDQIRMIISDRRIILNSITDSLIKLQKSINERLRLDMMREEDNTEIEDYLSPKTL